ncbi:MAG: nucleotide exchange factor GrpE, partial [Kiritimatiellia bacterium]|nr:nucleotide exchange factor GrpE [Kiritimatiellia bacterium]
MSKNKEKHHSADEAQKGGQEPARQEKTVNGVVQDPDYAEARTPAGQEVKPAAQEIDQLKDQLLRLRADFDNYRKRSLREKGEIYENANEALMLELLPVIDHLQLALDSAGRHKAPRNAGQADQAFQEGLQLIADQLMTALAKYGLNPFNSEKQSFDANLHEAISCLPSENEPEGTII